jgi:hypothetical protein
MSDLVKDHDRAAAALRAVLDEVGHPEKAIIQAIDGGL